MDMNSVLVPSVVELAKEQLTKVPERYVLSDQDPLEAVANSASLPKIPVIDISKFLSQDLKGLELEKLHFACKEWGFYQVCHLPLLTLTLIMRTRLCASH